MKILYAIAVILFIILVSAYADNQLAESVTDTVANQQSQDIILSDEYWLSRR